jgi:hypothetical protein
MTSQPPISPPPELRNQWHSERPFKSMGPSREREDYMIDRAAQWGADQELDACWGEVSFWGSIGMAKKLRDARRPKPPSLKEQALVLLNDCADRLDSAHENTIRRALEALPND